MQEPRCLQKDRIARGALSDPQPTLMRGVQNGKEGHDDERAIYLVTKDIQQRQAASGLRNALQDLGHTLRERQWRGGDLGHRHTNYTMPPSTFEG